MTADSRQRLVARLALATGLLLLLVAIRYTDWSLIAARGPRLAAAAAAAIAISGLWQVARTLAWRWCFPAPDRLPFLRLFRVRLAAEAVSYVTVRGVAGEPLKVVLLGSDADPRTATAAVALERLAYLIFTTAIIAVVAFAAWLTLPLTRGWSRTFLGFAIGSLTIIAAIGLALFRRRGAPAAALDRAPAGPSPSMLGAIRRFAAASAARALWLVREEPARLPVLFLVSAASYACMALEVWVVFRVAGAPISFAQAFALETLTRVASFATAIIPANLGALEAASLAAAAAVGSPTGSFLALARRVRGLFWAAAGFALFPHRTTPAALPRAGEPGRTHDACFADAPLHS